MKRIIFIFSFLFCLIGEIMAQQFSVHTNLASDALMMPSVGAEIVTGNKTSLDLSITGTKKPWGKDVKGIAFQPEFRYWFGGRPMYSFYVGAGAMLSAYNVHWAKKNYEGTAAGAGLTLGYAFKLSSHLSLTLHAGCGLVYYSQKEYFDGDNYSEYSHNGNVKANAHGIYYLPTNAGLTFSYLFK